MKKLTSILLAVMLVFSMTAVAVPSVSAVMNEDGTYTPGDNIESTYRYYFAMPEEWYNEYTDTAGVFWWTGSDLCVADAVTDKDIPWPGYKANADGTVKNLYYVDCPTDVGQIIWNNYIDGGIDKASDVYKAAKKASDAPTEFYSDGDTDLYDTAFFKEMGVSFYGDKTALGEFADNFFIDTKYDCGLSFTMNNMIYIVDTTLTNSMCDGVGEWYFYYGNGEYGSYPTKEDAQLKGVYGTVSDGIQKPSDSDAEDFPDSKDYTPEYDNNSNVIYFNVKKSGWNNVKKVFCHIWRADGAKTSSGTDWPAWQIKKELCEYDATTGIATYDLSKTGNQFSKTDGKEYCVIFSANTGMQTYNTIMSGSCIGDTMYCNGEQIENPEDSEKKCLVAVWTNNPDCGPEKKITSTGNIVGTAYPEGSSDETLLADYLIAYYNDPAKTALTQNILNALEVAPVSVYREVRNIIGDNDPEGKLSAIEKILLNCYDPTEPAPSLADEVIKLGVGEQSRVRVWKRGYFTVDGGKVVDNNTENYTFTSSNPIVAEVDKQGYVYAKGEGVASIIVTNKAGKSSECSVYVMSAPASVKVSPESVILGVGEKLTISEATNSGSYANAGNLKWSSSNTNVATVTKGSGNKATITAKATGTANITIKTYNGKTATCKVTVKSAPTSVKLNTTSVTLGVGENYIISESTNSGSYANASNLKWSSSNTNVATVTKGSGNKATITAKSIGTANITIKTYNGKTATCKVTVKSAPTSVKLSATSVTLGKGETYTISESTNSGSYANATNLKWSSSNTNVATVTKGSGNKATITAKGVGTATITIKTYNGKTATCKVTVKSAPTSVKLSKTSITLSVGQTYTISEVTNSGSYANATNLKWSSSKTSVATVTKGSANKATITAKSKGTATITIKTYNGKTATCKVTVK